LELLVEVVVTEVAEETDVERDRVTRLADGTTRDQAHGDDRRQCKYDECCPAASHADLPAHFAALLLPKRFSLMTSERPVSRPTSSPQRPVFGGAAGIERGAPQDSRTTSSTGRTRT